MLRIRATHSGHPTPPGEGMTPTARQRRRVEQNPTTEYESAMSTHTRNPLESTGREEPKTTASPQQAAEIHGILSSERRYLAIKYLAENEPTTLRELAEYVATQIEGHQVESTDDEYDRYRVSLHQTHLDALADQDVIEFERKSGEIRLGENAPQVIDYMPDLSLPEEQSDFVDRLTSLF